MIRVIAVDLDGTLLRSDSTVSTRTVEVLARATAAGARVVVVTARPPRFTRLLAAEAGISGVAVCSNGAIVADLGSETMEIVGPLPIETARRTAALLTEALPGATFTVETGLRALIGPGYGHVATRDRERFLAETLDELWAAESCVKLLAWTPEPVTDAVLDRLRSVLVEVEITYSGGNGLMEISATGVSKVDALARLCADWGVGPEQVIAFGDMPNDLSVLRWAGTAVAVANAHPAVLAAAHRITASNDDDGVAVTLEELFADVPRLGNVGPGR
jgi:Cof subfamily protein (haloacid dehalogenase superfamily)